MKLSFIASVLSDNIEKIKLENLQHQQLSGAGGATFIKLNNLTEFRAAIENIADTGLFGGDALLGRLKELPIFSNAHDSFDITLSQFQELSTVLSRLYLTGFHTLRAIEQAVPPADPYSVSVKLPEVKSLEEMASVIKTVDRAFSQGIVNEVGGKVEIETVEPGSVWLIICLGAPIAVTVIGALVWAGVVIAKQRNSNLLIEKEINKRDLQNEFVKDLVNANKKLIDTLVESEAKLIQDENFQGNNEQLERIKLSILSFADIIQKGGEVHPALHAPDAVKVAFPPANNMHLIESRTKKLTENASSTN